MPSQVQRVTISSILLKSAGNIVTDNVLAFHRFMHSLTTINLSTYIEKFFILHFASKLANFANAAPINTINVTLQSNHETLQISVLSQYNLRDLRFKSFLFLTLAGLQLLQLIYFIRESARNTSHELDLLVGLISLVGLQTTATYIHLFCNKGHLLKYYLENLFEFKKKYEIAACKTLSWRKMSFLELFNHLLAYMMLFTSVGFGPCWVLLFHWSSPCKPSLVGSFLLSECHQSSIFSQDLLQLIWRSITKFFVFVLNIWLWYFGVSGTAFILTVVHIISTLILRECTQLALRYIKTCTNVCNGAKVFSKLQIFSSLTNCLQQSCLLVFFCMTIFTLSLSINLLVRFVSSESVEKDYSVVVVCIILIFDAGGSILFILWGMVSVFSNSKNCLHLIKELELKCKLKSDRLWLRSFYKSCDKIKIKFGDSNFIEELTPFKCLDFAINVTAQILLVLKDKLV